ncbi:rhamnosyltransferase [Microbacterium sp. SLBN-154]|uniref:glycosyltransferase n=1 Tax=Microbacterium sp. SLBN-154 TaxID=2768458 RepID=UPI00114D5F3F|nr:glycosyltransferase [Microbacterium sp. SLBN-154]TQK19001.1 rhamnosyltransferase [Microbacterium sp. SLBN-154]
MTAPSAWAVITSFHPDARLLTAYRALQPQVGAVVVVDDGSPERYGAVLDEVRSAGAHVIRLAENSGIGAALNSGIRHALRHGADEIVTFDQDSVVSAGFIVALQSAADSARTHGHRVGPVVPEFFADVRQVRREHADGTLEARHAIQSGMLLAAAFLADVGLMREDLFIDLVDTEFEMRSTSAGFMTVAARGLRLEHSLGRRYARLVFGRPVRLPGIPPVVTLSTPFRYYYRVRNRLVVNGTLWRGHIGWVARDTFLEAIHYANVWVLARPRRALWQVYRAAMHDARRGRMGRMPTDVQDIAATITWAAPLAE